MLRKKGNKEKSNFMEFIPIKSEKVNWELDENGLVKLIILRNSILDRVFRKLFNTPEKFVIDLDEQGSHVWKNIDGKKNIAELVEFQRKKFGKKAEPAYERLITFIKILKNNNLITFKRK